MDNFGTSRRMLVSRTLALLASVPVLDTVTTAQQTEVHTEWIDLPAKTSLWGVIAFFSTDLIEISIGTRDDDKSTFRGRFAGKRLIEYSWRNQSGSVQRIGVRATALGAARDVSVARAHYWGDNLVLGFGQRATPAGAQDREGAYPHEAVLLGFRVRG